MTDVPVPDVPWLGSRLVESVPLGEILPFVNEIALFRGQWGFKKGSMEAAEYQDHIEDFVRPIFRRLGDWMAEESILLPQVVYGWYECQSEGDDLIIWDPDDPGRGASDSPSLAGASGPSRHQRLLPVGRVRGAGRDRLPLRHDGLWVSESEAPSEGTRSTSTSTASASSASSASKRLLEESSIGNDDSPTRSVHRSIGAVATVRIPGCLEMSDRRSCST